MFLEIFNIYGFLHTLWKSLYLFLVFAAQTSCGMNGGGSAGINGGATITNGTNSAPNTLNRYFFAFLKRISLFFLLLIFHIVVFPTLYLLRYRWQQLTLVMPLKEISFQLLRLFTKSNSNLSARSDRSFTRIYKGFTISLNWIASSLKGKYVILKFLLSLFQCVFPFLLANSFVFVFVYIVYLKTAAAQFFSVKRKPMSTPNSPTRDRKVPHDYFYDETLN